jgi:hypothetical protein
VRRDHPFGVVGERRGDDRPGHLMVAGGLYHRTAAVGHRPWLSCCDRLASTTGMITQKATGTFIAESAVDGHRPP